MRLPTNNMLAFHPGDILREETHESLGEGVSALAKALGKPCNLYSRNLLGTSDSEEKQ